MLIIMLTITQFSNTYVPSEQLQAKLLKQYSRDDRNYIKGKKAIVMQYV
jgi:hypothetical protein